MDGYQLCRLIREDPSTAMLPVIIISAYADEVSGLRAGADDYITKPFNPNMLIARVAELLRISPRELEVRRVRNFVSLLSEENKKLEEKIEQLSSQQENRINAKAIGQYKAIGGAVAHSLKGEFLHIGHTIRELRELAKTSADLQEECDVIERSLDYSQILLQRLLDYLDIGSPHLEPVRVLELVKRIGLMVKPRLPSSIQLEIIVDPNLDEQIIQTNLEQLLGVLLELIQNAVNILREKGGTIELKMERRVANLAISVRDNGPGIPAELRKQLFKKQVSSQKGLGLGLFLSKKVVQTLGGWLSLRSSPKGTTFTILLPMAHDKKEP